MRTVGIALLAAVAAGIDVSAAVAQPALDSGSASARSVPILFNDRHVAAKPDRLTGGRVLAALVRGSTVLVPLRSIFEQMGAVVRYDGRTRTAEVRKPGADVIVTVGKPEVVINGETRPLDVPPELDGGSVLVPIRVLSEGMGAYVAWVPDRRIVVVRYLGSAQPSPPPPPSTAPAVTVTSSATPRPSPLPSAAPKKQASFFVAGDYVINPRVYNEFSPGNTGGSSYDARAGVAFPLFGAAIYAEADARQYHYPHRTDTTNFDRGGNVGPPAGNFDGQPLAICGPGGAASADQGCVTTIGGNGRSYVPSFDAVDSDVDARVGLGLPSPQLFIAASYIQRWQNYGYPKQQGFGAGLEKLPDYSRVFSLYGSMFYFPDVGAGTSLQYRLYKYDVGGSIQVPHKGNAPNPLSIDAGFLGDRSIEKADAPGDFSHSGAYVGLGLHF